MSLTDRIRLGAEVYWSDRFCSSCGCSKHQDDRANRVEDRCGNLTCDCHSEWWASLDELELRWWMGDK